MNIYIRMMTALTFIAFTLIKKANFRLDPDNIGMFALLAIVAFVYKLFYDRLIKSSDEVDFTGVLQSIFLSS